MMGANAQWKTMMQRERRWNSCFEAISTGAPSKLCGGRLGGEQYPLRVEDLLKDPRTSKRHLRALYPDPMTGKAFAPVLCGNGRVKG
jgi:hypothetical protein